MSKLEAENLFASILHRWSTGDVSNFEKDYSENIVADFDGEILHLQDLKKRLKHFGDHYEVFKSQIIDFVYEEPFLAVRLALGIREKENSNLIEDEFCWLYEIKDQQVIRYWAITNHSFGFSRPENI